MKKLIKIINSIILCIRFPFLYPRNRFTGKHYNNWKIIEYIRNNLPKAKVFFTIQFSSENNEANDNNISKCINNNISDIDLSVTTRDDRKLIFTDLKSLRKLKEIDLGESVKIKNIEWISESCLKVVVSDTSKLSKNFKNKTFNFFHLTLDPILSVKLKIIEWIHDYFLQLIFCIPSHTELDALDKGWRKKFGIDLCKDLKKSILKSGGIKYLYSFRIMQIKEKWGELCLYCCNYTDEVSKVIAKYEKLSSETCIVCGKPAKWRSRGWICPYCDEHIEDTCYADPIEIE